MHHSFNNNEDGAVAIIFGGLLAVLVAVIGISVDYSLSEKTRSEMQAALDRAVLAAVQAPEKTKQRRTAKRYYKEQGKIGRITKFKTQNRGTAFSVSATAEYRMPTFIMGIFGKRHVKIRVQSTAKAPMTISTIQFTPDYARGWWIKTVRLMVRRPGSKTVEEVQRIRYTFVNPWRPSEFVVEPRGRVNVGKFDHAYLQMDIDPNSFNKHKDCPRCATTLRTDDPATSDRLFVEGRQVPKGQRVDIFSLVSCGEKTRHEWEDGGGHNPDFGYEIEVTCDTPSNKHVRLAE